MSEKIAIIYKSKYGSTKRYAGWIAIRLDADLYEVSDIRPKDLDDYDIIIYGGGLYIGNINGVKFITKNYDRIKNKKIIIFSVGMESDNNDLNNRIIDKNFDKELIKNIKLFNFRGAFDYRQLNLIDKLLMKGLRNSISQKSIRDLTEDDKRILEGFEQLIDLCDKKSIDILVESV